MILQALDAYYERLIQKGEPPVPPLGFAWRPISFELVIDQEGNLLQVKDLREPVKNRMVPTQMVVPYLGRKKAAGIDPDFLWGPTGYLLGGDNKDKPDRVERTFNEFKKFQHQMGDNVQDEGLRAVLTFLDHWDSNKAKELSEWDDVQGTNIVFRLEGRQEHVHQRPILQNIWKTYYALDGTEGENICLICGEKLPTSKLHPGIKGVDNTATAEAALVSFNLPAFKSYGKEQNLNAPACKHSAFNYTTSLNYLLRRDNHQRVKIADTVTVFWTARESPIEGFMGMILNPQEDAGDLQEVRLFLEAVRDGKMPNEIGALDIPFYVLGLSPNAARISIRFWNASTVGVMAERIGQHFRDFSIARSFDTDPEFPGMRQLLRQTAVQGKSENIPPLLAGALMRSVITGSAYPQSLLSVVIGRIRADQSINYLRAALIKACLVRKFRIQKVDKEVTMSLDKESTNIAYRLGRLFAVLEKAQKDAIPRANTTIKDRFYGSASATPRVVFPQLLRLAQHHIQKLKEEFGRHIDKMIEEIVCGIKEFPAHLNLDDQGLFAIGYYHQRQAFYAKSEKQKEE
jgi:CRISPR-associated protein Csd1